MQLWVATGLLTGRRLAVGTTGASRGLAGVDVPAWYLLGGLASPLYITSGILLFPRMGALAAGGLFVTGQMLASVALTCSACSGCRGKPFRVGIAWECSRCWPASRLSGSPARGARGPTPRSGRPTSRGAASGQGRGGARTAAPTTTLSSVAWIALGVIAGAVLPIQGAVSAKLRTDINAPVTVAMISFIVATLTIAVVLIIMLIARRTLRASTISAGSSRVSRSDSGR